MQVKCQAQEEEKKKKEKRRKMPKKKKKKRKKCQAPVMQLSTHNHYVITFTVR